MAKANGKPYGKIITTTPNNIDVPEGLYCHQLMANAAEFTEELYDWSRDEIEAYINDNSDNDFLYIKFTWQQLGLSPEWYRKECRVLDNDSLKIKRELDLQWTKATDNSVFTEDQLDAIHAKLPEEPLEVFFLEVTRKSGESDHEDYVPEVIQQKYPLKIYIPLILDKKYLIGVDTSGGTGRDNSAFTITDPDTLKICATFKNNKINISYYTDLLENLIKDILPNSFLIIERNSYGLSLIQNLIRVIPNNLFYDKPLKDKDKEKSKINTVDEIVYGVNTSETSRMAMMDLLFEIVADDPHLLAIPEVYDDMKTLVYNKKGKIEHETGCHDDVMMSYLFTRYAIQYSTTMHLFLRKLSDITDNVKVLLSSAKVLLPKTIAEVNRVQKVSTAIEGLTIHEMIEIRDKGLDIAQYLKGKNGSATHEKRRDVKINVSTLTTLRR